MATRGELDRLLRDQARNTILAWGLTGFVAVVVVEGLLSNDIAWAGFAAVVLTLAVVPPVAYRNPRVLLPWEVLALAALPLLGRAFATQLLTGRLATYLAVAAVALVVAVELDVFTTVRMTEWFAVLFVVIATMAAAGVWAVVRWAADLWLGTSFLLTPGVPEAEIEEAVMWEFVYSTAAGILAGVVFEVYFRRRSRAAARLPVDLQEEGR
ncbi:MAG: hypothetical protein ABEJ35_07930 [Halobacteriaceae archaeon]